MVQLITKLPSLIFIFLFPPNGSNENSLLRKGNANMPCSLSASKSIWKLQIIYPSSHLSPTIGFFFPLTFFFPGEKQFFFFFFFFLRKTIFKTLPPTLIF